jgi:hypothetical protein
VGIAQVAADAVVFSTLAVPELAIVTRYRNASGIVHPYPVASAIRLVLLRLFRRTRGGQVMSQVSDTYLQYERTVAELAAYISAYETAQLR